MEGSNRIPGQNTQEQENQLAAHGGSANQPAQGQTPGSNTTAPQQNGGQQAAQGQPYAQHGAGQAPQGGRSVPPYDQQQGYPQQPNPGPYVQNGQSQGGYYTQQPAPPYPGQAYPIQKADNTKLFSILSYLSVLWLIGLLIAPDNARVKFHVNQGILLSIASAAFSLVMTVLNTIFTFLPVLWIVTGLLSLLGGILILVLMIIGICNAAQDREVPLPVIGTIFTVIR